jgi:hypothetical protein
MADVPEEFDRLEVREVKKFIAASFAYAVVVRMRDAGYEFEEIREVASNAASLFGLGISTMGNPEYAQLLFAKPEAATEEEYWAKLHKAHLMHHAMNQAETGSSATRFLHWLSLGNLPGEPSRLDDPSHGSDLSWDTIFAVQAALEVIFPDELERESLSQQYIQGALIAERSGGYLQEVPGGFYDWEELPD